jgi:hypothetical protein
LKEKVPRTKQQRHGLSRHDRIIFRRWKVGDSKGMPQDYISIINTGFSILDPFNKSLGRLTRGLRNVAFSRMDLVIVICRVSGV